MTRARLRLRGALLVGTLIPLLLLAVVSLVVTVALTNSLDDADASIRSEQVLSTADLVTNDVLDAETGMRGFVITSQESFLGPYIRGTAAFPADVAALKALLTTDPAEIALIQSVGDTFDRWNLTVATPVIAKERSGAAASASTVLTTGEGKVRIDSIRTTMAALTDDVRSKATDRLNASRTFNTNVRRVSFYGTLLAIILGIVIAVFFARRISRRVRRVSTAATELAAGNLAERVTVDGHDEIADLATAFNGMASQLETAAAVEEASKEQLRRRTAETELANRELESFSYSVSHDLRAPLRSIDGFSQALVEDYADRLDDAGKDYVRRVRAASQRMALLIDDLLRLSRITRDPLRTEQIDVSELATGTIADLRAADPGRRVAVKIQPGMRAVGDSRLVRIALENLIGNAWKFTAERGDATIDVQEEPGPDGPEYVVADNGAGFDMRYATNLFGPFQRMHPVERFAGTGIGLATVQRIVHRHGGSIRAESEVERGTRFRFTLGPANEHTEDSPLAPTTGSAGVPAPVSVSAPASVPVPGSAAMSVPASGSVSVRAADATLGSSTNVPPTGAATDNAAVTARGGVPGGR